MKFYNLIIAIVFFLIYCEKVQSQNCIRNPEFSHCYQVEKFKPLITGIEKKLELPQQVQYYTIQLLADINGDCKSELITFSRRGDSIFIIDLVSAALIKGFPIKYVDPSNHSILLADLDGDNFPEIIIQTIRNQTNPDNYDSDRLICYSLDGSILWISDTTVNAVNNVNTLSGSIGVCDFNRDGIPEVYTSNKVFNALTGKKLADGGKNGLGLSKSAYGDYYPISVAANLDQDTSDIELAAGFSIYKVIITNPYSLAGNSMIPFNLKINGVEEDGATSIADINSDGILDVIVSSPSQNNNAILYAYYFDQINTKLIASNLVVNANLISISSIGKLNKTGNPSILFNISTKLFSFRYTGLPTFNLDWVINTTDTSGVSGIVLFDIDGDGIQEIINRDMNHLRIFSGESSNPVLISQVDCYSPTDREFTTIVDYDKKGDIKICVTCTDPPPYRNSRITVFGPPNGDRWAPARGIWNQYAYNPLFIDDDLTVPRYQKNQSTYKNGKYNNFMQQESLLDSNGMYKVAAASLLGDIKCINYDPFKDEYVITYDVWNRKDASRSTGDRWYITFYNGNPENGGVVIDSILMTNDLQAGDTLHDLMFSFKRSGITQLFMVVNTSRTGGGVFVDKDFKVLECDYTDNNSSWIDFPIIHTINSVICKGRTYIYKDSTYDSSGRYYYFQRNAKGCDEEVSIIDLAVQDTLLSIEKLTGCDSIIWNGSVYHKSGSYQYLTLSVNGCDSIAQLDLDLHYSSCNCEVIAACDSLFWQGTYIKQSGTYKFNTSNAEGCDSLVQINLTINNSYHSDISIQACNSYNWNNKTYTQSGDYSFQDQTFGGCDSIITLHLTIDTIIRSQEKISTCNSYNWNGVLITQDGIYIDTFTSVNGCDSIITLDLTIHQASQSNNKITRCDSLIWNGTKYTQSGFYTYQTLNAVGCDSIATLDLIIHQSDSLIQQQSACDKYDWNNKTYTQSGKYTYQTTNRYGCDSINILDLNILSSSTKDTTITVCDSLNFLNKTLKADGNYSFTIPNVQGCDSVINLNLNISSQILTENISKCGSYTWNVNGKMYDSSGIYQEKYSNRVGCDSIHELNLTINKHYDIQEKAEVCKEYRWPVNQQVYKQSGEYLYPLKTIQGCDSILTLELTIYPEFKQIDTVIATSDYLWPVNQKLYPTSGTYEEDFTSSKGCDSIHLLLLTIDKEVSIYYPNVIHPGGVNEWFTIFVYGHAAKIKVLSIYDRWGELVWQKESFPPNELQQGWNGQFRGKQVLPGVYVWYAEIELQDGRLITEKGDVTVLR